MPIGDRDEGHGRYREEDPGDAAQLEGGRCAWAGRLFRTPPAISDSGRDVHQPGGAAPFMRRLVPRLSMTTLTPAQIETELRAVPRWSQQGQSIARTFQFKDFAAAIAFVNRVAALADEAWHHPDIDVRWNAVTLTLTTHDAGGLTERDFSLAASIDAL